MISLRSKNLSGWLLFGWLAVVLGAQTSVSAVSTASAATDSPDSHNESEHHESSGLPQLNTETFPSQLFWLAVSFGAVYLMVAGFGIPKVRGVIDKRATGVLADLDEADSLRTQAEQLAAQNDQLLARARQQAQTLFNQTLDDIKMHRAERLSELDRQIDQQISQTETDIARARATMSQQVDDHAAELSRAVIATLTAKTRHNAQ